MVHGVGSRTRRILIREGCYPSARPLHSRACTYVDVHMTHMHSVTFKPSHAYILITHKLGPRIHTYAHCHSIILSWVPLSRPSFMLTMLLSHTRTRVGTPALVTRYTIIDHSIADESKCLHKQKCKVYNQS